MPNFKLVSAKEILARVIRSVGYKLPSTYHDDILEWIPEAIGMLQVTNTLVVTSSGNKNCPEEILVKNHCADLPCGFVSILAVEDENGYRIPEAGDVTDFTSPTSRRHAVSEIARVSTFEVNPFQHQTSDGIPTEAPGSSIPIYGSDLEVSNSSPKRVSYYKIQGNYIHTSFETGFIKIHYLSLPVDKEGYPLVPDNENFKQAIEWYIIKRLIGAGYEHKVFSYKDVDEQYEKYANRGMNEVSYRSLDTAARTYNSTIRLIPPHHFNEDFFVNSEQSERIYK